MDATAFSSIREEIDWLLAQQPTLLKLGVMASRLVEATEMLRWLEAKFGLHDLEEEELAERLTGLMIDVLWSLGDGLNPCGTASRVLYGADPSAVGLPLRLRRVRAARQIVLERADGPPKPLTVETWLRNWEPLIRHDVAWSLAISSPT